MKKPKAKSKPAAPRRGASKSTKAKSKPKAKAGTSEKTAKKAKAGKPVVKAAKTKPAAKVAKSRASAKPTTAKGKGKGKGKGEGKGEATGGSRVGREHWVKFVEKHGVVLASARGPVPSVAEAVAGEPIVGSWWAHPKGSEIFEALSSIDDSLDIRCFKLVDGKVTFVHRAAWPALVRLGRDGVIAPEQLAAVEQEHMPTGEHRNIVTPFPDWVDDDTSAAADALTTEQARAQLAWAEG